ncbi:hypothetical protein Ais01nite_72200 [Asanoa ishikariensis]|uniref:DUF3068 domain-containing protein n=1 Tax=Asanoa ishikariensis TaxID=137265 RepID=A0A1H3UQ20_9ACTN|nr:DUF3068 domain-containing protein [Asanoa ishikariensis]GIF69185.1 hypothetical protein Ais01nite_72200 [Asanoa ishikariensis]SDZ64437.1 Protein of unknown function [Asanoa ishikariensis]
MTSRAVSAVLFGVGVVAVVFAAGLAFVVGPRAAQLPYDLEPTQSIAEAPNATFMQITNGQVAVNTGTLRSTIRVQADRKATAGLTGDLDGSAAVWLVGQDVVRTDNNERVSAYSTSLAVDRKTAAAQKWDGQWLDTGGNREDVDYSGQIYKFPFGTEKKDYQIFDRDVLATQPAKFVKTEEIAGLETYQFTQEIREGRQQVPADRMSVLVGALAPGATSGEIVYDNTRTVWVEPTTGQFIKVQEVQHKNLLANNGVSVTILDATFTYTDDTIKKSADTASSNRQLLMLVKLWGPLVLLLLGVLLIGGGLLLLRRRPAAKAVAPAPEPEEVGAGRHLKDS